MCFFIDSKIRKAKTPIRCYKVLFKTEDGFQSPFIGTSYKIGHTYKAKKWLMFKLFSRFYRVFYTELNGEVIHAYIDKGEIVALRSKDKIRLTEWEIPKGTKYFVNDFCNEIVAPKMKFIKVLDYKK